MKKLMIMAAIVCTAVAVQAASYNWKTAAANQVYVAGSTTEKFGSGTAYLFDTAATGSSVAEVFALLVAGNDITGLAIDSSTISSGAVAAKTGSNLVNAGATLSAFFAVVDGSDFYISTVVSATGPDTGYETLSFKEKASSQLAAKDAASGYAGAGWYTASVPEPTSGLLLLLGMAGLALKRKRA